MNDSVRKSVRIERGDYRALSASARRKGKTVGELVKDYVDKELKKRNRGAGTVPAP